MASIIDSYIYDIFISYRQKDNKGERWVSEFVDALKDELESTFKEEISVYFDINPHDGLLETHDVDASLKEKLKCLIFVPIISRTYCDPKSFAWAHEFKAFIELASGDKNGIKVNLAGGNVASRILPVLIHDLDSDDKKLVEGELGGILRGIEFIYSEPGVNRPLTPNDDEKKNLNGTRYKNQINKVANAIKEIIGGIKNPVHQGKEILNENFEGKSLVRKIIQPVNLPEKSIAVLPLINVREDPDQEWMSVALTNEIINHLYKIASFEKVVSLNSVLTYKRPDKKIPFIAEELKVNYILEGTFHKIGDQVKLTVHLIDPQNDKYLWQNDYNKPYKEIISIQSDIAMQIAVNVNAFMTVSEKRNIQKIPTCNMEAYDLIQRAMALSAERSISVYQGLDSAIKAIKLDPAYADAYAAAGAFSLYSAVSRISLNEMPTAIRDASPFIEKALKLDPNNSFAHFLMGNIYEWGRWDYVEAEKEYLKVKEISPNITDSGINNLIGEFFLKMNRMELADHYFSKILESTEITFDHSLIKSLILSNRTQEAYDYIEKTKAISYMSDVYKGENYLWLHEYDLAKSCLESTLTAKNPLMEKPRFLACLALACSKTSRTVRAKQIINQIAVKSNTTIAGSPEYYTGWYYSAIGEIDSAFIWLDKALYNKSPEMPWLKQNPFFNSLKGDKRYWDLYEKTGHKTYDDFLKNIQE